MNKDSKINACFLVLNNYVTALNNAKDSNTHYLLWDKMVDYLQSMKDILNCNKYVIERDISAYGYFVPYSITYYKDDKKEITFEFQD